MLSLIIDWLAAPKGAPLNLQEIQEDFRRFKEDTASYSDNKWRQLPRLNPDDWINMETFCRVAGQAMGYPIAITEHDNQRFITPFYQDLLKQIRSGQVRGYTPLKPANDIRQYHVRLGDLLETLLRSQLPDGHTFLQHSSYGYNQPNEAQPQKYIDLKSPLFYALIFMKDQSGNLPKQITQPQAVNS